MQDRAEASTSTTDIGASAPWFGTGTSAPAIKIESLRTVIRHGSLCINNQSSSLYTSSIQEPPQNMSGSLCTNSQQSNVRTTQPFFRAPATMVETFVAALALGIGSLDDTFACNPRTKPRQSNKLFSRISSPLANYFIVATCSEQGPGSLMWEAKCYESQMFISSSSTWNLNLQSVSLAFVSKAKNCSIRESVSDGFITFHQWNQNLGLSLEQ